MLEQTRRQASIFVYLIFGLLIVIFVYGINPGSHGDAGCSTSSNTVVSVDGSDANNSAFLVAYSANQGQGRQKTYQALDEVIWREMLATAAAERGIRTTGDLLDDEIMTAKRGYFYLGGRRYDVTDQFFEDIDGEKLFSRKRWLGFVAARNLSSPNTYREEQARGLQAALMADLLTTSVRVSRDEALANYQYENNTVTYDVVAFDPATYRRAMRLTEADTKRFLDEHTAEVQARYKADERTYKAVKPELALREIFIPKALPAAPPSDGKPDGKPDAKADDKTSKAGKSDDKTGQAGEKSAKDGKAGKTADKIAKADDKTGKAAGDAVKPFGLPVDAAKAKLEAVRAEIGAGKLTFADAEKQLAADSADDAPAENGDRGWRKADDPQLGETAVNTAAKALKPGEMTPVIATDRGVFLVIATAKREGDLGFDQVKSEIAAVLAKEAWSKEAAKRDALDALARAQTGGKTLDQLYEREVVRQPTNGLEQILQNPNLTDEQKRQILQQLMEQQKHGSLELHEQDVPVAWYADDDGAGSSGAGGGAAPAAGSTAPKSGAPAPAAGSAASGGPAPAAPSGGAASGSPAPAAATGSAASGGPAPAAAGAAPSASSAAPAAEIVASKETLPQFGDVAKPKLNRFGPMPRQAKMAGVGTSKEAIATLFDELSPGQLAKRIYEGDNGYVVLQLINRAQPKIEDFDKTADAEIARMQEARGKAALHAWLKDRCETLNKAGRIRPAPERIREVDDKGNPAPTVYRPCMYLDYLAQ